jgi:hypothetical protein
MPKPSRDIIRILLHATSKVSGDKTDRAELAKVIGARLNRAACLRTVAVLT